MTINEVLVLTKAVRERVGELRSLRDRVSTKDRYFMAQQENKVVEPQYNVVAVDKKITELEMFLFKADAAVKQANATTQLTLVANVDTLLAPLEAV